MVLAVPMVMAPVAASNVAVLDKLPLKYALVLRVSGAAGAVGERTIG